MNQLQLYLKPNWDNETISSIDIQISIHTYQHKPLQFPISGFNNRIPFPQYSNLIIQDDSGNLELNIVDADSFGPLLYKEIKLNRDIIGNLKYSYTIFPRVLPKDYRSCPYFDFRKEEYGATGSGLFSLILPNDNEEYEITTQWNLENLPEGCHGLFNFDNHFVGSLDKIRYSFFIVGNIHQVSNQSASFYWLKNPDFDIERIGQRIIHIFDYMKSYFKDEASTFKVFIRRDPFSYSGGGTACPYAFLSGYSTLGTTDLFQWENTLIHEMTHTWLSMSNSVTGYPLTWFNEGSVEYYCTFIPYKGGFYTKEEVLKLIDNKIYKRYYQNEYRTLNEKEIEKIQWSDMKAQTIPYGKGMMYLLLIDFKLKNKHKSLDDIIIHRYKGNLTEQNWIDFLREEFGEKGIQEYYDMLEGKLLDLQMDVLKDIV